MTKYNLEQKIVRKGFPTSSKEYKTAHKEASKSEKKKFPSGYQKLKKLDEKIPKGDLIGKNTRSGKIEVSKVVPKSLRKEVAFHEMTESKNIKRLKKKGK